MGAGLAHADNDYPYPPPVPGHDWHGDDWDGDDWHGDDWRAGWRAPYDLGAQVVWNPGLASWGVW
jgi:hypothetical protein